ncbi:zinc ribbon domain-containing protein [Gluconobacter morbifer]|uniref:Zinc-ribbon domain-containing protein n=1 Tax=Gluconobacter morbifer G707 TaxID=1088869 RepID=G6XFS4_9PROT|nr:zinc ribbon domain-containing protein [Gluconobacter morbifer]EHH69032.1 hypothetical protein GMO_03390 [Gluconobacter morbifer G707]
MMEPQTNSVAICPVCRKKIRPTAEKCPHCGAERHFGPRLIESSICAFAGMVLLSAISTLLLPISLWTVVFAAAGLGAGFLFSHNRFGGDRWLP